MKSRMLSVLAVLLGCTGALAAPPGYFATILPEPGQFPAGNVVFVNTLGHAVVLGVDDQNNTTGTFFWSPETGYRAIREPGGGYLHVHGFNDRDQAVGLSEDFRRGAVWSPSSFRQLNAPNGYATVNPQSVNDRGVLVGGLQSRTSETDAFHATKAGIVIDGAANEFEALVNDAGGVVLDTGTCGLGRCTPLSTSYVINGKVTPVVVPGGGAALVSGLDDAGELAISSPQVAYWSPTAGFVSLGFAYGDADGITSTGAIVGNASFDSATPKAPFLWTMQDGVRWILDLVAPGSPDPDNFSAFAVSANGIVGGGSALGPVLLTPTN